MRIFNIVSGLFLCVASGCGPAAKAGAVVYPATEPGRHAREFFLAFNAGAPEMRAFYAANISVADLKDRTADDRLAVWHDMRANHGSLTPVRVLSAGDDFIEMSVRTAHHDMLRMRFNCRPEPPHTFTGLMVQDDTDSGAATDPPMPAGPPPTDAQLVAALSGPLDSLVRAGAFSGVVVLDKGGTRLFEHAYGMASREAKTANTLDTHFNLGSINKIFTTIATMQLVHAGKLGLSDPIAKYLPDYPHEAGAKITIEMLLHHKSGVPDVLEVPALWKHPGAVRTAADWYAVIRDQPLNFEPGTREEYSNGGFVLLGMIIERVSGEDYYAYIRHHVYQPAGMTQSEHYDRDHLPANTATPYSRHADDPARGQSHELAEARALPIPLGRGPAAGGGYSTAGDLVRFAQAFRAGALLGGAATSALLGSTPGLGIAGGSPGVNAVLEISGPYTLVVLANLDPPAAMNVAHGVSSMLRRAGGGGTSGGLHQIGGPRP